MATFIGEQFQIRTPRTRDDFVLDDEFVVVRRIEICGWEARWDLRRTPDERIVLATTKVHRDVLIDEAKKILVAMHRDRKVSE